MSCVHYALVSDVSGVMRLRSYDLMALY